MVVATGREKYCLAFIENCEIQNSTNVRHDSFKVHLTEVFKTKKLACAKKNELKKKKSRSS